MNRALQTPNKAEFYSPGRKEEEPITDPLLSLQHQLSQCRSFPRNQFPVSASHRQSSNQEVPTWHPTQCYPIKDVLGRNSHVVGQPAGQPGSSPGQCDGDRSAWPPHEPGESPPAAASHSLLLSPEISPWPGSAKTKKVICEQLYPK